MTSEATRAALLQIAAETDLNRKALFLAALISESFRARGLEPVVVGGSAIEFYTDGAYMSGDIDFCWAAGKQPTPAMRGEIMASLGSSSDGPRTWKLAGLFVDLLNDAETYAQAGFTMMETPFGSVVLAPVEDLIVERVFVARCWTGPNPRAEDCAKKLLAAALTGKIPVQWPDVARIAALPAYQCSDQVEAMKQEVQAALAAGD